MKNLVLALAAVAILSSPALAGGTKGNSTVTVQNCTESGDAIAVIVLAKGASVPSGEDEFFDQGGKVLEEGDIATFNSLKAGDYVIWAAYVESDGDFFGSTTRALKLKKNQTRDFCVEEDDSSLVIVPK